jgi:hypothetical protein
MTIRKTFKREIAVALLLWLAYVVEVKDVSIVEVLVWPIFAFVTAAFGIDQYSKLQQSLKSTDRRGSEGSSQYTGGEDQQSDSGNDK